MAAQFDTHKYIRSLREAGMPESQAETIIEAIRTVANVADVATKSDVERAVERMEGKLTALETKFTALESKFTGLETKFSALEDRMDARFSKVTADMIKWMVGIVFAGVGLTISFTTDLGN